MKNSLIALVFVLALYVPETAEAQDTTNIVFKVPTSQVPRIVAAMKGLYEIPKINTGTEENPVWTPAYTDSQWSKECIRRWVRKQVARWEQKVAQDEILYTEDSTLIRY